MSIGKKLRELREAKSMSLEDIARLCGTTRQTIYKYENDIVTNIPYDRIILLAKALGTTPSQLFDWEEDNKKTPDDIKVTGREAKILEAFNAKTPEEQKAFLTLLGIDLD